MKNIEERSVVCQELHTELFSTPPTVSANGATRTTARLSVSIEEIETRCRRAANHDKFQRFFDHGDWSGYASQSEAEAALIEMFRFAGADEEQADQLFRRSALVRGKWDERHARDGRTYGQMTTGKVFATAEAEGRPRWGEGCADTEGVVGKTTSSESAPSRGYTMAELKEMNLPAMRWTVAELIPEGLTILAAPPKTGKSWLAAAIAFIVGAGGRVLDHFDVEPGSVLYLALEDNERRMKGRLRKMFSDRDWPKQVTILHEWPRFGPGGGLQALNQWLTEHPDTRVVIIDTLVRLRAERKPGASTYDQDSAESGDLQRVALKHRVAIIVVHHTTKASHEDVFGEVSGSFGLIGGADTILVLKRPRNSFEGTMHVTGRDVDDSALAVRFDPETGLWTVLGDAVDFQLNHQRREILDTLREVGEPLKATEIAEHVGRQNNGGFRTLLFRMVADGLLVRDRKCRYSPAPPMNPFVHTEGIGSSLSLPSPSPPSSSSRERERVRG